MEDTLAGKVEAKRERTEHGMITEYPGAPEKINVPTLVVCGENDRVEPPERLRQEVIGRIRSATLVILPGVGHLSPLEDPLGVANAVRSFVSAIDNPV